MQIRISAFEAVPAAATEGGMAFHWATEYAASGHDVTVVTQQSSANTEPSSLAMWRERGIKLIAIDGSNATHAAQTPFELVQRQRSYGRWCEAVRRHPQLAETNFDLLHHVSWSSVRLESPLSGVTEGKTVWGPLGGGQPAVIKGVRPSALAHELLRNHSFPLARARQRSWLASHGEPDVTYVTNNATADFARSIGIDSPRYMLADGVPVEQIADRPRSAPQGARFLWLGRLVGSKRPDIAIRTVHALRRRGIPATLTLAGAGPEESFLRSLVERFDLTAYVSVLGKVPWQSTRTLYDDSDILMFTSMRDSSCPTVLEAAARGMPSVAIRHQGVGDMVSRLIALGPDKFTNVTRVINEMAFWATRLLESPTAYAASSEEALRFARKNTWNAKAKRVLGDLT